MNKLDAKLVAYLAGEEMLTKASLPQTLTLESLEGETVMVSADNSRAAEASALKQQCGGANNTREQQLDLFKRISGIRLNMEALTLQPEGTKRMELLQSEIRPIFTVECQLSNELTSQLSRSDMFNIMQFESEKFHSLTQCTRFGQEDQRQVKLDLESLQAKDMEDVRNNNKPNLGRIRFTVWWREPGTCLNEMLGMGVLELEELYNAALLEQCKCITINRRGIHLASIYCKISMQLQLNNDFVEQSLKVDPDSLGLMQYSEYSGGENNNKQQKEKHSQNNCNEKKDAAANAGEYAGNFLFPKDVDIQ